VTHLFKSSFGDEGSSSMSETQLVSNGDKVDPKAEKTEQGIVVSVKEGFGFLRSPSIVDPLLFRSDDVIDKTEEKAFDLHEHLTPGTDVSFVVGEREEGQLHAHQVRKLLPHEIQEAEKLAMKEHAAMSGEAEGKYREHGIVCRLKDTNGFISRPRPHLGRLFFHFKYVRSEGGWKPSMLDLGSEVSYIVCHEGSRMFAADVVMLPKGTIVQESKVEGTFKGHVIKPATAPAPEDHREDGLIGYTDDDGIEQKAYYGHHSVEDQSVPLDERDEVQFNIFRQLYRQEGRAVNVKLLEKAPEQREFGKIAMKKSAFGFIKCCERHNEVLFSFDQVDSVDPDELQVGDDVAFTVKWDLEKGKQIAIKVSKAAPGSAIFETVTDEVFYGIVVERLGLWKQYGPGSTGTILYESEDGTSEKLSYGPSDLEDRQLNPQVGDKASFRIAVNLAQAKAAERLDGTRAKSGGRRATHVSLVKYMGRIASIVQNGSYGFIDYEHERGTSHIFFHCSEVDNNTILNVDDTVQFVRVYNPNKQQHQARRVIRIEDDGTSMMDKKIPLLAMERALNRSVSVPERSSLVTGNIGGGCSRIAKGPDGSRGFEQERPSAGDSAWAKLDPSAPPFVPQSLRVQRVESTPVSSSLTLKSNSVSL